MKKKLKVLIAASEAAPFVKTGGLGDVIGALPQALKKAGAEVAVVLPLYETVSAHWRSEMTFLGNFNLTLAWRNLYCGVYELRSNGVTWYFIDNEYYFLRKNLYGHFDDGERFAYFSQAVLASLPLTGFAPDIIHCNDWQTALVPAYLRLNYSGELYDRISTVFTIHNIEYQGRYSDDTLVDVFGIDRRYFDSGLIESDHDVNLLKAGIVLSDRVTTVSPTYAREICEDPAKGHGLEGILNAERGKLDGIINGIDTVLNNPADDKRLWKKYTSPDGKAENKKKIRAMLGLPDCDAPLIAMVSRLVDHKGFGIVADALPRLLDRPVQIAVLGTGDWQYEQLFRDYAQRYPGKVSAQITFDSDLATKLYAASDMFLMPSLSEPCGLSQLIAMRYGSVPIVRHTGGLADTVTEGMKGTGFVFNDATANDLLDAVDRALTCWADQKSWAILAERAMSCDFGWEPSAAKYMEVYRKAIDCHR